MRAAVLCLLAAFALGCQASARSAETVKPVGYPSRPITIIVPFARGGGLDVSARLLSRYAGAELGEMIEILNQTQGGNILGNQLAVNADPDGYTLGCWGKGLVTDQIVIKNVPYSHRDVIPVCMYADDPHIIVAGAEFAARNGIETLQDLMTFLSKNPGKITFGTGGNWTSHDFVRMKMEQEAGASFARMPFLGGAPAVQAAADGNCDIAAPFPSEYLPHADSGKIIPLAVTYSARLELFPGIPTAAEAGCAALEQSMWRVLTLPKGTARSIAEYLESVFRRAAASKDLQREAQALGIQIVFKGSAELEAFLEEEYERFLALAELFE